MRSFPSFSFSFALCAALAASAQGFSPVKETRLVPGTAGPNQVFGTDVAVSGDTVVVGAPRDLEGADEVGAAFVFVHTPDGWVQQARLRPPAGIVNSMFGYSVAISGDTIAVSAYYDPAGGAAYVFVRQGTQWTQQVRLLSPDADPDQMFGDPVALDGDTLVVGAIGDNGGADASGAAYVFERTGTDWTSVAKLKADPPAAFGLLGWSLALSGQTVAVGSPYDDGEMPGSFAGTVYLFTQTPSGWIQQQRVQASDAVRFGMFGSSVALNADRLVVGAPYDNRGGDQAGAAYAFRRTGAVWGEEVRLQTAEAAAAAQFGYSVAVNGDVAAVGSVGDSSIKPGGGCVHLFATSGPQWNWTAGISPNDVADFDKFGFAVAFDGRRLVAGAPLKSIPGCGDACSAGGSAYVYAPNLPPLADATATATKVVAANRTDAAVTLDGSRSSDPDGDPLTYSWQEAGREIAGSQTASVTLTVGTHPLTLTVSDGLATASTQLTVAVVPANAAPVADATATVTQVSASSPQGAVVTLDASRSSDPDNDPLTFSWLEQGALVAQGMIVPLPLAMGTHVVTLEVNDGQATSSTQVTVNVVAANAAPLANASATVREVIAPRNLDAVVRLDASRSSDPDGDALTFAWLEDGKQIATGAVALVRLGLGTHQVVLVVTDGHLSARDQVSVHVITPAEATRALMAQVKDAGLPRGRETASLAILAAAARAFDRDHMRVGIQNLRVFQRTVSLPEGQRVSPRTRASLISAAQRIIDAVTAG